MPPDPCAFCTHENMRSALAHSGKKASMARLLKKFYGWHGQQPELYDEAVRRVGHWEPEHKSHLEQIARAPTRKRPAPKEILGKLEHT